MMRGTKTPIVIGGSSWRSSSTCLCRVVAKAAKGIDSSGCGLCGRAESAKAVGGGHGRSRLRRCAAKATEIVGSSSDGWHGRSSTSKTAKIIGGGGGGLCGWGGVEAAEAVVRSLHLGRNAIRGGHAIRRSCHRGLRHTRLRHTRLRHTRQHCG
jgi:hypothetical protein